MNSYASRQEAEEYTRNPPDLFPSAEDLRYAASVIKPFMETASTEIPESVRNAVVDLAIELIQEGEVDGILR